MNTTSSRLRTVRTDINALLSEYYAARVKRAGTLHEDYAALWRTLENVGAANGKRLRPYVMLVAYEGLGGKDYSSVLPIAAALEILHTSLLIHDDIIDRDYMRHGQPNVAGQYLERYAEEYVAGAEKEHYANAAALLAGDLALSGAYELVITSPLPSDVKVQVSMLLSESVFAVAGGELLDSEAVLLPIEGVDTLTIAHLKTAVYSFVIPLRVAGVLAEVDRHTQGALEDMGKFTGIAFQLADDILGLYGDQSVTGKPNTSDLKEGKRTYIMQRSLALGSPKQRRQLLSILGSGHITDVDAEKARAIIRDCGALAETRALMRAYADKAELALSRAQLTPDSRAELLALIHKAIERQS
jgi:geranylgeranyl pyrophosphate synthase